jgi:predicted Fe-Mo cluster-binding NifX family protein
VKIAAVTEGNETISPQFSGATKYSVLTVEEGQIIAEEIREVADQQEVHRDRLECQHKHQDYAGRGGYGLQSLENHLRMLKPIFDCKFVLTRGMDQRAYIKLQCMGIQAIITDIPDIKKAVQAVIDGSIDNHLERLH